MYFYNLSSILWCFLIRLPELLASEAISLLLASLPKLPSPFEEHWLGNAGNLGSNRETQKRAIQSIQACNKDVGQISMPYLPSVSGLVDCI